MLDPKYRRCHNTSKILSPGLLFFELIKKISRAGDRGRAVAASAARQNTQTIKIVRAELEAGITKHKVATVAEAEMLAGCGVPVSCSLTTLSGSNYWADGSPCPAKFPTCTFSVLADDPGPTRALSEAMASTGRTSGRLDRSRRRSTPHRASPPITGASALYGLDNDSA